MSRLTWLEENPESSRRGPSPQTTVVIVVLLLHDIPGDLALPVGQVLTPGREVRKLTTAVIDCLVAKFLDLSAIAAHESKKAQIVPCHIQLGTLVDEDLNKLFQAVTICEGRIHGHLERGRILRVDVVASGYVAAKPPYPSALMPELASNRALQAKKSRATGAQDQVQSHPAGCAQPEGAQQDVDLRVHHQDAVPLPQLIPHKLVEKSKVRT
ncbi:hypothetical protein E2I00_016211 [Balaenoptera physalus]|uniref:Histone H2A n=1 Tax=Balaenoptera physalus TaxID=9770 RepID=A0A643C309_BALPH|nr:hypothetical protein E2I00_016211 [Balaenoptera physalus]